MKHYQQQDWIFGEGAGPTGTPGFWEIKDNFGDTSEEEIAHSEEMFSNDDIMAMVIFFRRMKKDSLNKVTRLLQSNQIAADVQEPFKFMEVEDAQEYLNAFAATEDANEWLPLLEEEARRRNLHSELNQAVV